MALAPTSKKPKSLWLTFVAVGYSLKKPPVALPECLSLTERFGLFFANPYPVQLAESKHSP
jgi:hypothetical protein